VFRLNLKTSFDLENMMLPGEKIIKEKVPDFDLLKIDMVESITIYFLYTGEKTKC